MSERTIPERICPQCGLKTAQATCPTHGIPTLARITGAVDTVQTGEIIGGRYRVDKLLGKGGFGAVFRATHMVTQQELVLKVLKPNLGDDETQVKRFLQEARTASKLSHPNTVRVYDFGQTDAGHLYLAMELLHGQELGQVLIEEGILAPERVIHIAIGVLKSLAEAHQAGLVHRDLKPDNIFLCNVHGEDDFVKVIDFGIAKPIDQGDEGLTRTGFTVGTPKYMSPEQVLNKGVEGRSDLYSLGVILYQCLSGELPLSGPSPVETMMAHVQQDPAPLSAVCPQELPPGLEAVVMRALRKLPNQRFVDAEDMRAALEEVQEKAGLTLGKRARSAKLRAVTPQDLNDAPARPMPPAVTHPAPEPLDQTIAWRPNTPTAPVEPEKTLPVRTPQPPTEQTPVHVNATLDLRQEPVAPPAATTVQATTTPPTRGAARAVAVSVAVAAVAIGSWIALRPRSAPPAAPVQASVAPEAAPLAAAALLAPDLVEAAVAELSDAVAACKPEGAVQASVLIDARGHATDVQVRSPQADVDACVAKAVRGYAFRAAKEPHRSALLVFSQATAPAAAVPAGQGAAAESGAEIKRAVRHRAKPSADKPNGDEAL